MFTVYRPALPRLLKRKIKRYRHTYIHTCMHTYLTLDLSPSRAGQHTEQCVSSNQLCPPPRREHLPTSVPILQVFADGLRPIFSSVFLFPFFVPESSSLLVWLFYSCSFCHGHMTQPRHTYIRTYIHTYMHTCIHAYLHTCIHAYMHTCIRTYVQRTHIHTYINTHIHKYIHTYVFM